MSKGSLIVIGTGIRTVGQLTIEAIAWLRRADKVLYVVGDPIAEAVIADLNPQGADSFPYVCRREASHSVLQRDG
jgi:precorrin-2 methylase